MVDQIIRPADLPNERTSPNPSEWMVVDNNVTVAKATIENVVLAGRPSATQAEAEVGVNAVKAMTPLTTKQSIASQIGVTIASKAQGDKADTALQSIVPGANITVDNTDPLNPLVSASGGVETNFVESRAWAIANYHPAVAPAFIETAGYSASGDSGGALYKFVISEPTHIAKFSIVLDDTVTIAWYELSGNLILTPEMFGASVALADNSALMQAALSFAANTGTPIDLGPVGKVFTSTGVIAPAVSGKNLTVFGEAKLLFSGSGYLNISGSLSEAADVASVTARGSRTININTAALLAVGDMIAVEDGRDFSFSPTQNVGREAYHAGDFNRISGISGTVLTLERPLRDGYVVGNRVYKVSPVELVTSSFEVEASNTPTAACLVSCVVNGRLDLHVKGGNQYAAFFNRLWLTEGRGGRYIHTAPDTGNNYGIVVGNAQDCNFFDIYAYGTRRGIATGTGGGPAGICMRNVWFTGGASDNGTDVLGSADLHGDADDCGFIGHRASFFDIGGRSSKIIDCETSPRGAVSPIAWTELAGGDLIVRNLKVTRPDGATFTDIVSGRNSAQLAVIKENYSITVDGVTIMDGSGLVGIVGFYHAAASPVRAEVFVDNVKVLGGAVASNFRLLNSTVQNVASHPGGVAAPVSLVVGDNCVWQFANTHFWMLTSGTHTGCRCWAPSTTFSTSFTVAAASYSSTAQSISFVGYPFVPKVECAPYGLSSGATVLFFGIIEVATQSTANANITSGNSTETPGVSRTLSARIEVSMRGAIAP